LKLLLQTILALVVLALGIYTLTRKTPAPPAGRLPAPATMPEGGTTDALPTAKTQATVEAPPASEPVGAATTTPSDRGTGDALIMPTPAPAHPATPVAPAGISTIAFARDGRLVIAHAGGIEYHDVVTGLRQAVNVDGAGVREMSFSPAGDLIAIAGNGATVLWSVTTSSARKLADNAAIAVPFSPDGRSVATGSAEGEVKLWDAASLGLNATLRPGVGSITSIAFAPDGRSIAMAGQGAAVWELPANRAKTKVANNEVCVAAAFSPDGHLLAAASGAGVTLWETVFWHKQATLAAGGAVMRCAFWRSGTVMVLVCADGSMQIWDVATRTRTVVLPGKGPIVALALSPDDRTLATAGAGGVLVWDTTTQSSRALP
jgi:hypothetical protein